MIFSFFSLLAWDGFLPVLTAVFPITLQTFFPEYLWLAIFMPIVNVIVRAGIGERQIRNACEGRAPLFRQLVMVAAILVLLVLDVLLSALVLDKNAPADLWKVCLTFYGGYLLLICIALRPLRCRIDNGSESWSLEMNMED